MLRTFSKLVVIEHSVFALPFALSAFVLALRRGMTVSYDHSLMILGLLVVVAIFFARTAAMAFNRYLDADIDALNPRTAEREIPQGVISRSWVLVLTGISATAFIAVSYLIGPHCFILSPFVIALLLGYSWAKHFSWSAHFVLGLCLAAAPGGAWWVVRPEVELLPLVLMSAVVFWVAGFDILYSCQDTEFDQAQGLYSIPARFGIDAALQISRFCHIVAAILFVMVGKIGDLGFTYIIGMVPFVAVLFSQHYGLHRGEISRINRVFFTRNGVISLFYFMLILAI